MKNLSLIIVIISFVSCNQSPTTDSSTEKVHVVDSLTTISNNATPENHINGLDIREDLNDLFYTFRLKDGLDISFHKDHIDGAWTSISVGHWPYKMLQQHTETDLQTHIENIDSCWNYVAKLGKMNITTLGLSPPDNYPDIAKNQTLAFNADSNWKSNSYNSIEKVMLKYDVYKPFNNFLKTKGFAISGYIMEKMSSISPGKQKSMGFENTVHVPSPMAISIFVERIKD